MIIRSVRKKLSEDKIKTIISMYNDGYGATTLCKLFNVSNGTVYNYLRCNNIPIRSRKSFSRDFKKYKFNVEFFRNNSNELSYFYGFCLGDGSLGISNGNSYLRIGLSIKDIDLLKMFISWIDGDPSMVFIKDRVATLRINNSFFKNDLSKWGLVVNKTYNPVVPDVPVKYIKTFLIGFIDADGSVKFDNGKYSISIVANDILIEWFKNTIRDLGYDGNIQLYDINNGKVWSRLHISNKNDVIKLANLLEVDKCDFCLDRKWKNLK